ncbi:MAG: hypothetical protein Q4D62_14015 [Planctomycetia bacterium]|nr:hypothetical protein [Planctomycetia bacterium]
MNEEKRRKFLGVMAFMTALVLLWLVCSRITDGAEITGEKQVDAGTLATFESDISGEWLVMPEKQGIFEKDTGGKKIYFASPEKGDYTVIFFATENKKPTITTFAFVNGEGNNPQPQPEPVINITQAEKEAAIAAFQGCIGFIDAGQLRTPQGVRTTFKNTLERKVDISETLNKQLAEWSAKVDFSTVKTIRAGFAEILKTLGVEVSQPVEKKEVIVIQDCPDGQCNR